MQQFDEKALTAQIEALIIHFCNDFKVFIAERNPLNHAEYQCIIAIVVPIEFAEQTLKEIATLAPIVSFAGSNVDISEERGVDILKFKSISKYRNIDEQL